MVVFRVFLPTCYYLAVSNMSFATHWVELSLMKESEFFEMLNLLPQDSFGLSVIYWFLKPAEYVSWSTTEHNTFIVG